MRKYLIPGIAFALALSACSNSGTDRDGNGQLETGEIDYRGFVPLKPGLWETRLVVSEIDLPTLGKASKADIMDEIADNASGRRCLSQAEATRPVADFFGGNNAGKCIYKDFDISGGKVKMELTCAMEGMGSADIELDGPMGATAFEYDSEIDVRLPMIGKIEMKGVLTGKYAGACPST